MTPQDHQKLLDVLEQALDEALVRYRALHHASVAELHEMKAEVLAAREALDKALAAKGKVKKGRRIGKDASAPRTGLESQIAASR